MPCRMAEERKCEPFNDEKGDQAMQARSVREGLIPPCVVGAVTVTHRGGGARLAAEPAMHAEPAGRGGAPRRCSTWSTRTRPQGRARRASRTASARWLPTWRLPTTTRHALLGGFLSFPCCSLGLVCAAPERA